MSKILKSSIFISFFLISLFTGMVAHADGSKDLYPSGKEGIRAWLRSSTTTSPNWPFANEGTHYVYAKMGETITLASSAQDGGNNSRIQLYGPDGIRIINDATSVGQIPNRTAELAGPQMTASNTGGNRYVPIYHAVTTDGIYRVQFMARGSRDPGTTVNANGNWAQDSNAGIAAWDVSVLNTAKNGFEIGRVYTNILNLSNGTANPNTNGFYGLVYVLTKDGYIYKVNNNGNNGMYFTFFVNNNGFVDENSQEPIYKSLDRSTTNFLDGKVHDPNTADTDKHITHKLFYTMPSDDLPALANGAVPGVNTWLRSAPVLPEVEDVKIVGVDGSVGQVSNKGGFIQFEASTQGRYTIEIESTSAPAAFVKRTIIGTSVGGVNSIRWDGKGGDGITLPAGLVPAKVTIQLQGAEVHFPFFDMEYNSKGTIIELLDHTNLNNVKSDIVYWDDTDIPNANSNRGSNSSPRNNSHLAPTNSVGISSNTNGHIWGVGGTSSTSGQFGDNRSIDTWTFIRGELVSVETKVAVKVADLKVSSITPDKDIVKKGDKIKYTVVVENDGPSNVEKAPFAFKAPSGFEITEVTFTSSCAIEHNEGIANNTYHSNLDLENGCTVTYEITVKPTVSADFGSIEVEATIMRPNDVTDPDATNNLIPNVPPTDPYYEIEHNGFGGESNNINKNAVVTLVDKLTAIKTINEDPATVKPGQEITYLITIKNASNIAKSPVTASDIIPVGLLGATDISHGGALTNGTLNWEGLTVPANGELVLSFKTTVASAEALAGILAIKNIASIIDPTDPAEPLFPEIEVPTDGKITTNKTIVGNPASVKSGDVLIYNITIKNSFGTAKTGVTASDILPVELINPVDITEGGIYTAAINTINWTNLTIPANGELVLSFKVTVANNLPVGTTAIKNTAIVTDPTDPDPKEPEVEVPTDGKITTSKTIVGNPASVKSGDVLEYNITIKNSFGTAKTGVTASDVLPVELINPVDITDGGIYTAATKTINWTNLTIPANGELVLSFKVTVADNLPVGTTTIKNTAIVTDPTDPDPKEPEVEVPTDGKITTSKTIVGNPASVKSGDVLEYNITIKNSFGTAKTGVTASDVLPAELTNPDAISNGGIATGQTINWTNLTIPANGELVLSFKVTVADNLPVGTTAIKNTAIVTDPTDPDPKEPEIEVPTDGKITTSKTIVGNPASVKSGDVLEYHITIKNSFGTEKADVTASDVLPAELINPDAISNGGIATGQTINWTNLTIPANGELVLSFKVTVADNLSVGTTTIKNTAIVTDPTDPDPKEPEIEVPTDGKITTSKTIVGNPASVKSGDVLEYHITIKNSFGTEKAGVTASDVLPSELTNPDAISNGGIATGQIINWTNLTIPANGELVLSFKVTVADNLPVGTTTIKNTAIVTDPTDPDPKEPEVEVAVPSISLVKTAVFNDENGDGYAEVGETLTYTFEVTNTGGIIINNIIINDATIGISGLLLDPSTLAIGGKGTISSNYAIKQSDIDAGLITNIAIAIGQTPEGVDVEDTSGTSTDNDTPTETLLPQKGAITVTKSTDRNKTYNTVGDVIEYTIVVKNTGNVTLTDVQVTDDNADVPNVGTIPTLTVGDSKTFTAKHTVIQDDLDAGVVYNIATATGKDPKDKDVTGKSTDNNPLDPTDPENPGPDPDCEDCTIVPIDQEGAITVTKSSDRSKTYNKVGDVIEYTIVVKNTGNVTLNNVQVTDDNADNKNVGAIVKLAVGQSETFTANHTVTQEDLDAGVVYNIATATGKDPKEKDVTGKSTDNNPLDPTDPENPGPDPDCEDCTIVPIDQEGAITVTKSSDRSKTYNKVGDVIEYTIVVKNTGNVTLTDVRITDDNADNKNVGTIAKLVVGQTETFTAVHTVTQGDLDAGVVYNIATATGKDPKDKEVTGKSTDNNPLDPTDPENPGPDPDCEDCTIVPIDQEGAITVTKSSDRSITYNKVGDVIEYTIVVKNTGNVTLTDVQVTDDNADNKNVGTIVKLAVGQSETFTAKHTVIQGDLDAGVVYNIATATGKDPKDKDVTGKSTDDNPLDPTDPDNPGPDPDCEDCTIVPIDQEGSLKLTKTTKEGVYNKLGQVVDYNLVLTNTGNVTIQNIIITDDNADKGSITPANINELKVGEKVNITAKHTITQDDLDVGYVYNIAVATGKDPKGKDVETKSTDESPVDPKAPVDPNCPACTITPVDPPAGIALVKTVTNKGSGTNGLFVLGDEIEYSFTITNTGSKTLKDIVLHDPLLNKGMIHVSGILAPGKFFTHKEQYEITIQDVRTGKVTNSAVVKAKDPQGKEVEDTSGSNADNDDSTVTVIGEGPKALDDEVETLQNTPVIIEVLTNDKTGSSDLDLGSINIIKEPEHGTLTVHPDGTVTYTPEERYVGEDHFTYTVKDKNGMVSNEANVKVVIKATEPVGVDDRAETAFNTEVSVPVLKNDKGNGSELDHSTVVIKEQPKNGTVLVNADGTVTYRPNPGYTGNDHFTYTVKDVNGNETNIAHVDIEVTGFFIPNVFTPNGDGNNDVFEIVGLEQYDGAEVTIFNRWGNEVYRNKNYKNNWDGSNLNEGTYYYLITLKKDGKENVYKGWVLLKR